MYGYTADLSKRGLLSLARKLALAYEGERLFEVKSFLRKKAPSVCPIKDPVIDIPAETRIQFLRAMDEEMRKDARIVRARSEIYGEKKAIEIFAAEGEEGFLMKNEESHARVTAVATASTSVPSYSPTAMLKTLPTSAAVIMPTVSSGSPRASLTDAACSLGSGRS